MNKFLLLFILAISLSAQDSCLIDPSAPGCSGQSCCADPCGPDCTLMLVNYAPENGSCQPCWNTYQVVMDVCYGQACDAFCANPTQECTLSRIEFTSVGNCAANLASCTPSYPYLCTITVTQTDVCSGQKCGQSTGAPFCSNNTPNPTGEIKRAKNILASIRNRAHKRAS